MGKIKIDFDPSRIWVLYDRRELERGENRPLEVSLDIRHLMDVAELYSARSPGFQSEILKVARK